MSALSPSERQPIELLQRQLDARGAHVLPAFAQKRDDFVDTQGVVKAPNPRVDAAWPST
jgi:hypothetical protein